MDAVIDRIPRIETGRATKATPFDKVVNRSSGGKMLKRCYFVVALAALAFLSAASSRAQSTPQWVGTWATSPYLADGGAIRMLSGVTLRQIAHISIGGAQLRIRFTNEFGLDR